MTPRAPDYANPRCWSALPDGAAPGEADVFYVHPTTYAGGLWNQDLAASADIAAAVTARQTAPFALSCRIFAPRYRQASSRAFHEPGAGSDAAYRLAYEDVCAAFLHYLRHWHRGVLILAGHSQGALHVGRLLAELIEPEGLVADTIAAYGIGIGFSAGLFGTRFRVIAPCERPEQTGCLVSWNTFLTGGDASGFFRRTAARDSVHLAGNPAGPPVCINPVSFDAARPDMPGARVHDGVVWIDATPHGMPALPGGNMHMHDLALFERPLGENVRCRIEGQKQAVLF